MLTSSSSSDNGPPALPLQESRSGGHQSPCAQAELKAVECMRVIREYLSQLDAFSASQDPTLRNDLLLKVRKEDNNLRRLMLDVKRYAEREHKTRELHDVQHHCTATQALVRSHYQSRASPGAGGATVFSPLHEDETAGQDTVAVEPYSLHEDQEFAEFFAKTRERDVEMDVALDRIHAGVLRVHDNAHGIKDELQVQNEVMKEAETKVEENQGQMSRMNRKMQKAIKKLGKSRLITYCVMCVILLVLIIVIILLARAL